MAFRVEFIPEAADDFRSLDGSLKREAARKIEALSDNPSAGMPLGNRFGINLTGFCKIYFAKKRYRIVYRIAGDRLEIIEIFAIGRREKEAVYRMVAQRLRAFVRERKEQGCCRQNDRGGTQASCSRLTALGQVRNYT